MEIRQMLVDSSKYSLKCPYSMIAEYITIHNTANDASANNEISYMRNNTSSTSFHLAVDDKEVVQGIPFNRNAWHSGDGGSGTGNRKSIGIEICYSKSGGDRFIQAELKCAELVAQMLQERGWGIDRVKKHQDWSNKYCPHRTLDLGWERFLKLIEGYMYSFTIKDIENKKVRLIQDINLVNFENQIHQDVKLYSKDTIIEVSAIATTSNGDSYYLTDYSYSKGINNGFNTSYCEDYIEQTIDEEKDVNIDVDVNINLNNNTQELDTSSTNNTKNEETSQKSALNEEIEQVSDKDTLIIKIIKKILEILGGIYEKNNK